MTSAVAPAACSDMIEHIIIAFGLAALGLLYTIIVGPPLAAIMRRSPDGVDRVVRGLIVGPSFAPGPLGFMVLIGTFDDRAASPERWLAAVGYLVIWGITVRSIARRRQLWCEIIGVPIGDTAPGSASRSHDAGHGCQ
ncbi:MAG: hypothetical protein KGJ62_04185 [Armatimonadetes bacterium]|nr:hypothetical protein [Armatimonadota bacterium]MDE2205680.1 hypothetical protein [Armatimonadota bacterium]